MDCMSFYQNMLLGVIHEEIACQTQAQEENLNNQK